MNENQENNLNSVTPEVSNTVPVEPTPVESQAPVAEPAPVETPEPVTEPTPVQPVQPVVAPAPIVAPVVNSNPVSEPVIAAKKSNPVVVVLLILVLIGVCGYGLYKYTDILKPKNNAKGNETITTESTTAAKESTNEKSFSFKDENEGYYVENIYLRDGKIYVVSTSKAQIELSDGFIEVDGKKAYLAKSDVKDMFLVEVGQAGLKECIYTDLNGQAYTFNIYNGIPFDSNKIEGATNVVKAYSLNDGSAMSYILVDKDNNIISTNGYVYIDKVNNLTNNKLKDGTIVSLKLKNRGTADETGVIVDTYTATIGGKAQDLDVEFEYNKEIFGDYDNLKLIYFNICTNSNGDYVVGYNNCVVE